MAAAIGSIAFIGIVGWLIVKWDRQRQKDVNKRDVLPIRRKFLISQFWLKTRGFFLVAPFFHLKNKP
jgi:hypothetical protein